jgi:hypothetical protein
MKTRPSRFCLSAVCLTFLIGGCTSASGKPAASPGAAATGPAATPGATTANPAVQPAGTCALLDLAGMTSLVGQAPTQVQDKPSQDRTVPDECIITAGTAFGAIDVDCSGDAAETLKAMRANLGVTQIGTDPDRYRIGNKSAIGMTIKRKGGTDCTITIKGMNNDALADALGAAYRNLRT